MPPGTKSLHSSLTSTVLEPFILLYALTQARSHPLHPVDHLYEQLYTLSYVTWKHQINLNSQP